MDIVIAIALLGGLGLGFGLILAAASKVFYVETDPRLDQLNACLPGANCGGCGYAGCGAYAEAVLNGEAPIGACASGGNECAQAMAAIMGVKAEAVTRKVALVRCSGEKTYDKDGNLVSGSKVKGNYEGFRDGRAPRERSGYGGRQRRRPYSQRTDPHPQRPHCSSRRWRRTYRPWCRCRSPDSQTYRPEDRGRQRWRLPYNPGSLRTQP